MRLADLAALMQRTEGVEITSYLVADPRVAKESGVRLSHAGGLISWTMASTDNGFLWKRGLRIFFGQTQNPVAAHNLEDLGWRRLYTEVDWVRTT